MQQTLMCKHLSVDAVDYVQIQCAGNAVQYDASTRAYATSNGVNQLLPVQSNAINCQQIQAVTRSVSHPHTEQ